jgi:hypothetical protein
MLAKAYPEPNKGGRIYDRDMACTLMRVLPPAPSRRGTQGTRAGGKDARAAGLRQPAAPCVWRGMRELPVHPQRRAMIMRLSNRSRLRFKANLLALLA